MKWAPPEQLVDWLKDSRDLVTPVQMIVMMVDMRLPVSVLQMIHCGIYIIWRQHPCNIYLTDTNFELLRGDWQGLTRGEGTLWERAARKTSVVKVDLSIRSHIMPVHAA